VRNAASTQKLEVIPMRCKDAIQLLSEYQDRRLPQNESEEVAAHLQICAACQKEERLLANVWNMLNVLKPIEPSADFKARFWQRVREEELAKENWWTITVFFWRQFAAGARPAFALTSVLVVSILGTLIALKVLPQTSTQTGQSPILQWTRNTPSGFMQGGF
jgi:anti-sigma factor RsiW